MKVISYKSKGNSFPIVIQEENKKFLVKLNAGLSGEHSLLGEWFGNKIGESIGLNTRIPQWITLTNTLNYKDIYIEVRELIHKSLGTNIAFEYYENIEELNLVELSKVEIAKFADVYLLDILMLNIDRTIQNPNLLKMKNGTILISDFDSSLVFNELLNNTKPSNNKRVLQCLKSNPFYQELEKLNIDAFIKRVNQVDFNKIINEIPLEVLNTENKSIILSKIESKKLNNWHLKETLLNIEKTTLESENDRHLRTRVNREKLEGLTNTTKYVR